jgi:ATP-dependent exoDNAse (exonuclease V) beta subunit
MEQTPLINLAAGEGEQAGAIENGEEEVMRSSNTPSLPQHYRRLAADWKPPPTPDPVRRAPADLPDVQDRVEFRWAGEDARMTGNLVHRLLQLIAEQGPEAWMAAGGMAGRVNWCRRQLLSEGVQGARADSIISVTSRAIRNCLDSERGNWILESREEAESEYALTAVLNGQPRNLVLDRIFFEDGNCWIIDYKTSSHSGGDLEGFLQNETDRYREQMQRYREAVAINENRPIRTALYFPLLDRFCEVD